MIESGKFKIFVGFSTFPLKASIVYKDSMKLEVSVADLPALRAAVKKAIKKAQEYAPTEEEKLIIKQEREFVARVKVITAKKPKKS